MLVAFAVLDGLYGVISGWFCLVLLLHAVGGSLWLFGFAAGARSGFGHFASGPHIAMISGMPITASASWILAGVSFMFGDVSPLHSSDSHRRSGVQSATELDNPLLTALWQWSTAREQFVSANEVVASMPESDQAAFSCADGSRQQGATSVCFRPRNSS